MHPVDPVPIEEQVSLDDPFLGLPMETLAQANARRSRLLNRPASEITEVVRLSPIHGLGIFAGPEGSPARSVLEFLYGRVWYTVSLRVFTARGFNIPLGDLTWFTDDRMDSFVLQPNGQYRPCANIINAPLQFSQLLGNHRNYPRPPGLSLRQLINLSSRANCLIAGFMDRHTGTFRVMAETTTRLPPHAEWLAGYYPNVASVNDPNYLVDTDAFDWNGSAPAAQAAYLVRSVQEDRFDIEDLGLMAVDFTRGDFRALGAALPRSTWITMFIIQYLRVVHAYSSRPRRYWRVFLSKTEVRAVPAWQELWDWGRHMDTWMRTTRGWRDEYGVGDLFSQSWWAAFESAVREHEERPDPGHPFGYEHDIFGRPGTGYDPDEQPYGMPPLEDVNYTTFH